mmetsp:Transcript_58642/g.115125  ORF Transcript_58642/g.115125 Transcript_58642/m.115125 type:complete len:247 (+) Transcript_58642:157-897(+)
MGTFAFDATQLACTHTHFSGPCRIPLCRFPAQLQNSAKSRHRHFTRTGLLLWLFDPSAFDVAVGGSCGGVRSFRRSDGGGGCSSCRVPHTCGGGGGGDDGTRWAGPSMRLSAGGLWSRKRVTESWSGPYHPSPRTRPRNKFLRPLMSPKFAPLGSSARQLRTTESAPPPARHAENAGFVCGPERLSQETLKSQYPWSRLPLLSPPFPPPSPATLLLLEALLLPLLLLWPAPMMPLRSRLTPPTSPP